MALPISITQGEQVASLWKPFATRSRCPPTSAPRILRTTALSSPPTASLPTRPNPPSSPISSACTHR